jgi:hypothetical protein
LHPHALFLNLSIQDIKTAAIIFFLFFWAGLNEPVRHATSFLDRVNPEARFHIYDS